MSEGTTAYIGLGANLGDRLGTLREAVRQLGEIGDVTGVSSLYETAPVGYESQPAFLNAVVTLQTALSAPALVDSLLSIETMLGRIRTFRNAPRTVDLDLLLLDDTVMSTDTVQVPHPRLHERAFVLVPLAEIAPGIVHPVMQRTVRQLYDALGRSDGVDLVEGPSWISLPADDAGIPAGHSENPASG